MLALILRVPGWFTEDEKRRFALFEPDEFQYVDMAIYQIQSLDASLLEEWEVYSNIFNVRGFGIHIGVTAWILHHATSLELNPANLILIGRIWATIYSLLVIVVLWYLTKLFFQDKNTAHLAALLLAIFDLNITYSHYSLPEMAHVFWVHFAVLLTLKFYLKYHQSAIDWKRLPWWVFCIPVALAGAFASKFDFLVPVIVVLALLLLWREKRLSLLSVTGLLSVGFILTVLSFGLLTCFNYSLDEVLHSFREIYRQNKDVLAQDHHLLLNPPVYFLGLVAGTSLPVVFFAGFGKIRFRSFHLDQAIKYAWWLWAGLLFLEFMPLWRSDIPFVRRLNVFLPFVALMAAYGLHHIDQERLSWWRKCTPWVVGYTLLLSLIGQSNFWWDTRYSARTYLNTHFAEAKIKYESYAYAKGMPTGVRLNEKGDILVLHEADYSRYWKTFTSPFQYPPTCCTEVYHCQSEAHCQDYQQLLSGQSLNFKVLKTFNTREYLPERYLFKRLFGTYETFLGDVRIFETR
ncbi:MAG: hypothetical protein DHS20C18_23640 [Saprospiraceae bacterium]|nr:MAG: hypothetical protein DHS20C18_23640 [Saprospiraceae bacterium]